MRMLMSQNALFPIEVPKRPDHRANNLSNNKKGNQQLELEMRPLTSKEVTVFTSNGLFQDEALSAHVLAWCVIIIEAENDIQSLDAYLKHFMTVSLRALRISLANKSIHPYFLSRTSSETQILAINTSCWHAFQWQQNQQQQLEAKSNSFTVQLLCYILSETCQSAGSGENHAVLQQYVKAQLLELLLHVHIWS